MFYALQQCLFCPENKDKIITHINAKLNVQKNLQTEEIITLTNRINGLENAQNRLATCLEEGKAAKTILDKMQKNETELTSLQKRLAIKSRQIINVDDETYEKLIQRFVQYMSDVKSPETFALKDKTIGSISIGEDYVTIHFNNGVTVDEDTIQYFNM